MQTIQVSEAEADFPGILRQVERGETVVLTRDGEEIGRVVPSVSLAGGPGADFDPRQVEAAMASILDIRKRTKPVSLSEILSSRDEGRR